MDLDSDPGHEHFFKIYSFFNRKKMFKLIFFFSYFYAKNYLLFRDYKIFDNLSFFQQFRFGYWKQKIFVCSFWLIFWPRVPDPWIRMLLRIRIQKAKMLRIHRIRILSTGYQYYFMGNSWNYLGVAILSVVEKTFTGGDVRVQAPQDQ